MKTSHTPTSLTDENSISLTQFTTAGTLRQLNNSDIGDQITAEQWLGSNLKVQGAYIHVPFCFHKCHYCDFYSIAGAEDQHEAFVKRMTQELAAVGRRITTPLKSIFVGGGTPTLLSPDLFDELLGAINTHLPRAQTCEWTVEANPETVSHLTAELMVKHGVNRVSIGSQSFDPTLLKTLERWHDPDHVERAVTYVRSAGIDNINLDLIYAIPQQTISQLEVDLQCAMALKPKHLSCYTLIFEPNTPLRVKLDRGEITPVDHDVEADMFGMVRDILQANGFEQYEISNYARFGFECQHNLLYWMNQSWWPFGPAAAGHLNGRRWRNRPRLSDYLKTVGLPHVEDVEVLLPDQRAGEAFLVGLRVINGMDRKWVDALIEESTDRWRAQVIDRFVDENLLHWKNDHLALTSQGIFFADTVMLTLLMKDDVITDTTRTVPHA